MTTNELIRNLPALLAALFTAILFIQSGLDKVFDWKGNLGWLTGHFEKTFVAGMVPIMLATITVMEIATGLLAAAGIVYFLAAGSLSLIFISGVTGALTLIALFFGQRIAKDYPGAAVLVPYFLLMLVIMYLASPSRP
jgi:uncharacterized membrane protein YphA (DoxX/SURF4 family)